MAKPDETTSWVAPSAAPPAPAAPPVGAPPSLYGPPPQMRAARKPLHPGIVVAIVGGSILLIGGIIGVAYAAITTVSNIVAESDPFAGGSSDMPPSDNSPLLDGEPGSPVAVSPTDCETACFDHAVIGDLILTDSVFDTMTLTDHVPWYPSGSTPAYEEWEFSKTGWEESELGPKECFVTWPYAPLDEPLNAEDVRGDPVDYIGTHSDTEYYNAIDQVTRLFPDDETAAAYMSSLNDAIGECPRFIDSIGLSTDFVSRSPALEVPDSVAAVGWVQKTQFGDRYYVIDVQRGNLVVRTTGYSTGGYTELEFRDLVEQEAELLADLEIAG